MAKQESGFIQLPNVIMRGQLDGVPLDVYEYRILMFIAEKTIGYSKKSDGISLSQFMTNTGISKPKITQTIEQLRKKKLITVRKQKHKNGGDTYNRYSLKGVNDIYTGSKQDLHGGVNDIYTQNTIIQNMRERNDAQNVFYMLPEHEREKKANAFAGSVSLNARNPEAYKARVLKRIRKGDRETLEAFQEWYLKNLTAPIEVQIDEEWRIGKYDTGKEIFTDEKDRRYILTVERFTEKLASDEIRLHSVCSSGR